MVLVKQVTIPAFTTLRTLQKTTLLPSLLDNPPVLPCYITIQGASPVGVEIPPELPPKSSVSWRGCRFDMTLAISTFRHCH